MLSKNRLSSVTFLVGLFGISLVSIRILISFYFLCIKFAVLFFLLPEMKIYRFLTFSPVIIYLKL